MKARVKICGITRVEDAVMAAEAGADALGLMFYPDSLRHVGLGAAAALTAAVPVGVAWVGVFVNPTTAEVAAALRECGLDALQFHGEETPGFLASLERHRLAGGRPPLALDSHARFLPGVRRPAFIKAFRVRDRAVLSTLPEYSTELWLLDSYVPGQRGGTGAAFNWELACAAKSLGRPILLAGGLTPENVAEAVRTVRPFGVDVSSGVESAPGRKDPAKVRAFIQAARAVDLPEEPAG